MKLILLALLLLTAIGSETHYAVEPYPVSQLQDAARDDEPANNNKDSGSSAPADNSSSQPASDKSDSNNDDPQLFIPYLPMEAFAQPIPAWHPVQQPAFAPQPAFVPQPAYAPALTDWNRDGIPDQW